MVIFHFANCKRLPKAIFCLEIAFCWTSLSGPSRPLRSWHANWGERIDFHQRSDHQDIFLGLMSLQNCRQNKYWLVVLNMFYLGIMIPTDFHIFQRGWNHQQNSIWSILSVLQTQIIWVHVCNWTPPQVHFSKVSKWWMPRIYNYCIFLGKYAVDFHAWDTIEFWSLRDNSRLRIASSVVLMNQSTISWRLVGGLIESL